MCRHRAINIFVRAYHELWLQEENVGQEIMIEDLTQSFEDSELKKKEEEEEEAKPDPLTQLVTTFCRGAMTECSGALQVSVRNEQLLVIRDVALQSPQPLAGKVLVFR